VGITANTCDASDPEVKRRQHVLTTLSISQSGLLEIRHDKAAEATVNVETNVMRGGQGTEGNNVVLVAIWEVDGGAYELTEIKIRMSEIQ
jgi:hypothetical protein